MLKNYDASEVAAVMGFRFVKELEKSREKQSPDTPAEKLRAAVNKRKSPKSRATYAWRMVIDPGIRAEMVAHDTYVILTTSDRIGPSADTMRKAIESGLPRATLRRLTNMIAGGDEAQAKRFERLVVARTTLDRRHDRLSKQESERTERTARLFVQARKALGTEEEAREFMTAPHPELDGETPLQAAQTDLGARRVEDILNALEYGLAL